MSFLDKSGWITPHEPSELTGPIGDLVATGNMADPREWDVLVQSWGTLEVYSVGPFPAWEAAEQWAEHRVAAVDATIHGITESRRPKGQHIAPTRRPRAGRTAS